MADQPDMTDQISISMGHELVLSRDILNQVREAGDFSATDFQLDGVFAVTEHGAHSLQPVPVRAGLEWRMYGTPEIGIKWRQVPVDAHDVFEGKLDPSLQAMQERMTKRAYDAFGQDVEHQTVLGRHEFLLHDTDMGMEQTRRLRGGEMPPLEDPEEASARVLQGYLRKCLIAPLNPWYHIMRLVQQEPLSSTPKGTKTGKNKERTRGKGSISFTSSSKSPSTKRYINPANPPPPIPWCRCWMSLEPTHELDPKAFDLMQQVVFDFEENQLDTCLRRIDNIVLWRKRVHRDRGLRNTRSRYSKSDEVLVELAALCNRFGLKLYFMGRLEASNAFYSRVLQFSNANSTVNSGHNPELYAWTCDLIAFCLWHQGKFESAHHALSRSVHPTVTTNIRIVSRLHAALLLLNQEKADLSLKISSLLLIELLQQRHAHTLLVLGPGSSADATQTSLDETAGVEWAADVEEILRIIEFRHEQMSQPSAPAYVNLLCHATLTVAHGLAHKGRFKDAMTVANVLAGHLRGGSPGVSRDLKDSVPQFQRWLDQVQADALKPGGGGMMLPPSVAHESSGSKLPSVVQNQRSSTSMSTHSNRAPFRTGRGGGAHSAEPAMSGPRYGYNDVSMASSRGSIDGRIYSGGVAFEAPPDEKTWASGFFGDVYWQRHNTSSYGV